MNLEIKSICLYDEPLPDGGEFCVSMRVEIGERDREGAESFWFVAASPAGLANEVSDGGYKLLRGHILMAAFDMNLVRGAIEKLIDQARSRATWAEVVTFLSRYSRYDSEDLDGEHFP
jgi:hypothetical protein